MFFGAFDSRVMRREYTLASKAVTPKPRFTMYSIT
jgi:hypothetical protein